MTRAMMLRRSTIALALALASCRPAGPADGRSSQQEALDAIEALHQADLKASRSGDTETLLSLWSDDPAVLRPRGPIVTGRDSVETWLRGIAAADSLWETVEYVQEFREVQVVGDYAWDWGTYRGRSRNRRTGQEVSSHGKLLRILKREPDGSWKVHRAIWNQDPGPSGP